MKEQPTDGGGFEKVGECLYRYSSTGGYYARIKTAGKEIRRCSAPPTATWLNVASPNSKDDLTKRCVPKVESRSRK
jgi:hypothetical protein